MEEVSDMLTRGELNLHPDTGLFLECSMPDPPNLFEGECIPNVNDYKDLFADLDDDNYPHAWRGAVICFVLGFVLLVINTS